MMRVLSFVLLVLTLCVSQTGCVKGCVDSNAINYDPSATANSGCIYPETFNLTSVRLSNHPTYDADGNDWDLDGEPDKFFKIFDNDSNELLQVTDVESFLPVSWSIEPSLSIKAEESNIRFELYDMDETENVLMDQAVLPISDLTGTSASFSNDYYPESITIYGDKGSTIVLTIEWTE